MKLNVGCGKDIREGWVNLDREALPGVDIVCDLDVCSAIPITGEGVSEIYMSHILEHLTRPLQAMQMLHSVAAPGCLCTIKVPYGSSDNAWEDPTHVRPYFLGSFQYFSQLSYSRADYGYRGDWRIKHRTLLVEPGLSKYRDDLDHLFNLITRGRNFVIEMTAVLEAVKPIRAHDALPKESSPVKFDFQGA